MRRYVLTGAPGSGKTSVLTALQSRGYEVVQEAAASVIAGEQERGDDRPWARASFVDKIVALQRQRQRQLEPVPPRSGIQIYDRSPVCTLALSTYLGYPVSAALSAEIDRIERERSYDRRVFFVREIGFCEPTAARRITFEDSLKFERVHEQTYQALGYELVEIPAGDVTHRADAVEAYVASWGGGERTP